MTAGRLDAPRGLAVVDVARGEEPDAARRGQDEAQLLGGCLDPLAGGQLRDRRLQRRVLALEGRALLDRTADAGVHAQHRDLHEDDADQPDAEDRDPHAAAHEAIEEPVLGDGVDGRREAQRDGHRRGNGGAGDALAARGAADPARRGRHAPRAWARGMRCGAATRGRAGGGRSHAATSTSLRAARSRADFARGLAATSSAEAAMPRPIRSASGSWPQTHTGRSGGQMHPRARSARKRFTRRSSREWNEIPAKRPSFRSSSHASGSAASSWPSSSLTAMRIAWNVRFAGWPPAKRAGTGIASVTISTSCWVVSIGVRPRARTIARAIWPA